MRDFRTRSQPRPRGPIGAAMLFVAIGTFLGAACGTEIATEPSPVATGLTGTWTGQTADSSGPGNITCQITQSGASFSGSLTISDPGTGYSARGAIAGTVSASSVQFSMHIPAGGFDKPYSACTADLTGEGSSSASAMTGTYSGTNSCTGPITGGQLSLGRQQ